MQIFFLIFRENATIVSKKNIFDVETFKYPSDLLKFKAQLNQLPMKNIHWVVSLLLMYIKIYLQPLYTFATSHCFLYIHFALKVNYSLTQKSLQKKS